jgi:hypothetical protein
MADETSRFNLSITLDITDATTGEPTPFSKTIQQYSGMKYEDMQAVQAVAIPALVQLLIGMGNAQAEEVKAKRGQGQDKKADKFER